MNGGLNPSPVPSAAEVHDNKHPSAGDTPEDCEEQMLTARGYQWLCGTAVLASIGLVFDNATLELWRFAGLTLLVGMLVQWLVFAVRVEWLRGRLDVQRRLWQGGNEPVTLWAEVPFTIELELINRAPLASPLMWVEDVFAPGTQTLAEESGRWCLQLPAGGRVLVRYRRQAVGLGSVRSYGVQVVFTDGLGLFHKRWMLRAQQHWWVLPPLVPKENPQRASKGFNQWPPPGIHRWRRPGTGSELLDLRDYQAGDPPKMIAWKVSARRDQLITKELESDVPVRCLIFLDTSDEVRLGDIGRRPIQQLAQAAAIMGQVAAQLRDPIGLICFDAQRLHLLPPARSRQQLWRFLVELAHAAALLPAVRHMHESALVQQCWTLARFLYPDLLHSHNNRMPLTRLWRPLLAHRWGWLIPLIMLLNVAMVVLWPPWRFWCLEQAAAVTRWWIHPTNNAGQLLVLFLSAVVLIISPLLLASLVWLIYSTQDLWRRPRRPVTQRKQLAALLTWHQRATPAQIEWLLHNHTAWTTALAHFLQQHQQPVLVSWLDLPQRQQYHQPAKIAVLATALLQAVGRARDNELYVLLVDLYDYTDELTPLITACRVARARHHQVMVVVPGTNETEELASKLGREHTQMCAHNHTTMTHNHTTMAHAPTQAHAPQALLARQYYDWAYQRLRRQLAAVGVSVLRLSCDDPLPVLLERLDRLRGYRSWR
jgi:uncharacterized protein (DUF58 family)